MATLGVLDILISVKDDNVQSQLNKSEKTVKNWGNKVSAWTIAKGQMIGRFAETAIKSTARVMKDTVGQAVSAFGTYQQLEQGAELMFGKGFDYIIDKAETAYEKVQISKNEYLEQANAYATGLKNSLNGDGEAAAELADRIITAQADVVAATGASREGVENAFKGLLRGNYMMLDNLQIGIKGTKEGMKDVIDQVNKWNKANGKATKYQMDNLADMNNALIDYIDMVGMAGYAQAEGADTLQGSIASTKAAWKDLITNIGRGKDIKKSVENFGKAAKKAFTNLRPVIRNAVSGIFATVKELMPEIGGLFEDLKTDLKESDVPILRVLGEGLEKVQLAWTGLNALIDDFPSTVEKLKASDDPFARLIGGGLGFAKDTLEWIVNISGSVENAIKNIALAFAGIKIAPGVMSFFSKLLQIAANKKILSLFGGDGNTPTTPPTTTPPTTTPTTTPTTGGTKPIPWYAKLGAGIKNFWQTGGGMSMLTPFAILGAGLLPAAWAQGQVQQKWQNDYNRRMNSAGMQGDNAQFISEAAVALGTNGQVDWDKAENLLNGLAKRQNKQKAELYNLLKDSTTAGNNTWNMLNSFWEGAELDPSQINELLQDITDAFANGDKKVEVPVELDAKTEMVTNAVKQLDLSAPVTLTPVFGFGGSGGSAGGGGGVVDYWSQFTRPSHNAKGDWYVPRDNYPILAHRGELLLNQSQARRYRDGETGGVSANIPAVIAQSVKESMKQVYFLLNGDKVADLSYKRTKKNINAQSQSRIRAYGGA